jgi:hypothetical protein
MPKRRTPPPDAATTTDSGQISVAVRVRPGAGRTQADKVFTVQSDGAEVARRLTALRDGAG